MTYSEKAHVLVIEDNAEHFGAVKRRFSSEEYELEHMSECTDLELINYRALHPQNLIVIVDLNLRRGTPGETETGLKLIREVLWPVDRTAFFVVFTEHIGKVREISLKEVEPDWTFVEKKFSNRRDKTLTDECLDRLHAVVSKLREFAAPFIRTPRFGSSVYIEQIDQHLRENPAAERHEHNFKDGIRLSTEMLNECCDGALYFAKAGARTSEICIGVYGSCGRLEARPDSDIEFSVYYMGPVDGAGNKALATVLWNRMARHLVARGRRFEGEALLRDRRVPLLCEADIAGELPNEYMPVISVTRLLGEELQKHPHVRNRHLQILTEMKAVFNPGLATEMKRDLLDKGMGGLVPSIDDIVSHPYLSDLVGQFFRDARPREMAAFKDYKRFVYRVLHLFALRLTLLEKIHCGKKRVESVAEWEELFAALSNPGLYKVVSFERACRRLSDNVKGRDKLCEALCELAKAYAETIDKLWQLAEAEGGPSGDWTSKLRRHMRACVEQFGVVFRRVDEMNFFKSTAAIGWLTACGDVKEFVEVL